MKKGDIVQLINIDHFLYTERLNEYGIIVAMETTEQGEFLKVRMIHIQQSSHIGLMIMKHTDLGAYARRFKLIS